MPAVRPNDMLELPAYGRVRLVLFVRPPPGAGTLPEPEGPAAACQARLHNK